MLQLKDLSVRSSSLHKSGFTKTTYERKKLWHAPEETTETELTKGKPSCGRSHGCQTLTYNVSTSLELAKGMRIL